MGKFFDLDSPLMRALSRMADLIWLNILMLFSAAPALILFYFTFTGGLPVFVVLLITWAAALIIGPALTGMHYVLLKMTRDEESYITKSFFKSFRENFRQSVLLMAIVFMVAALLAVDYYLFTTDAMGNFPAAVRIPVIVVTLYLFLVSLWIFPLEARFVNRIPGTLKNAFLVSILAFPRTLAMAVVTVLPLVLFYFFELRMTPFFIMFGISVPAWVCALLYNKVFKRLEPETPEVTPDDQFTVDTGEDTLSQVSDVSNVPEGGTKTDEED
ncbi:MAG: DUF624 domain-containing protein [Lachnospiraceae bacterium]|nr:DUF624 domain-containing protein [Lachnospiraceae bacterium]